MMEEMQGGDLYQLQQEAIKRARETANKAMPRPLPAAQEKVSPPAIHTGDSMIVVAVLAILLLNGCDDMMLILALALVVFL